MATADTNPNTVSLELTGRHILEMRAELRNLRTMHEVSQRQMLAALGLLTEKVSGVGFEVERMLETQAVRFDLVDRQLDVLAAAIVRRDTGQSPVGEG
jgi:hypothetical protein